MTLGICGDAVECSFGGMVVGVETRGSVGHKLGTQVSVTL